MNNQDPEYVAELEADYEASREQNQLLRRELAESVRAATIRRLQDRIRRGIAALGRDWDVPVPPNPPETTWLEDIQRQNYTPESIRAAYRKACRANNMSPVDQRWGLVYIPRERITQHGLAVPLDPTAKFRPHAFFPFIRLIRESPEAAREIAKFTMVKESTIHFIARLDKHGNYPPIEGGLDPKTRLPIRFFWGPGNRCPINSSPLLRDVLAPLYVCRDFMEIFATAFYALNTFSFESVGEFNIFCQRTPGARLQRIQYLELRWLGSNMKKGPGFSRSRIALGNLLKMVRLKTLEFFVDESSECRIRRPKEPEWVRKDLRVATAKQENNRQFRNLRGLRGLQNLHALRGIERVAFFDYGEGAKDYKQPVRDQSFVRDVKAQITLPKAPDDERKARLENLKPLLHRDQCWKPSPQVKWVVRSLFMPGEPWVPHGPPQASLAETDDEDDNGDNNGESDDDEDDESEDNEDQDRRSRRRRRSRSSTGDSGSSGGRGEANNGDDGSDDGSSDDDDNGGGGLNGESSQGIRGAQGSSSRRHHQEHLRSIYKRGCLSNGGQRLGFGRNRNAEGAQGAHFRRRNRRIILLDDEDDDAQGTLPDIFPNRGSSSTIIIHDDDDVQFVSARKASPAVINLLGDDEDSDVEFIQSIRRRKISTPDPSMVVFISIEDDENEDIKNELEVKDEDSKDNTSKSLDLNPAIFIPSDSDSPISIKDEENRSPSIVRDLRRAASNPLFVSQRPSPSHPPISGSSWSFGGVGCQTGQRKRRSEDDETVSSEADNESSRSVIKDLGGVDMGSNDHDSKRCRMSPSVDPWIF